MGTLSPRFFRCSAPVLLALLAIPTAAQASEGSHRDVGIGFVEGDVRLSRGDGKRSDLAKTWEQAQSGDLAESGFALWSGEGRAEIDFEGTSVVFLAPNSLLLFSELSASRDSYFTRLTLATGTASFALEPSAGERFEIDTPTDALVVAAPETLYVRIGAYLDATSVTPIHTQGDSIIRDGMPTLRIAKNRTVFFRQSEAIEFSTDPAAARHIDELFPAGPMDSSKSNSSAASSSSSALPSSSFADWDSWVAACRFARAVTLTAALNASGLDQPILGLADLYEHGTFFSCAPYGVCWESNQPLDSDGANAPVSFAAPLQTSSTSWNAHVEAAVFSPDRFSVGFVSPVRAVAFRQSSAQNPASLSSQTNPTFQPQTVRWEEYWQDECGVTQSTTVRRVARSQQELEELLRRQQLAARRRGAFRSFYNPASCYNGLWIRHHNHYARVITPPGRPPHCAGAKCIPVHPPRPLWVRVGNKAGIVPRHPNDLPGKPPLNLKNGVLLPPAKPGESLQRLAWNPSIHVQILDHPPAQFQHAAFSRGASVAAPEIHAHLVAESIRTTLPHGPALDARITYNYKTREFMAPGKSLKNGDSRDVAVGSIHSNGRLASFADGHSHSYASSFYSHSAVASSYNAGHYSSAMNGGSSSGGFHSSAGGYSGSGGGGSRGGGSSGSSGGSGHTGGSAGGASAGGGGGGGHPH